MYSLDLAPLVTLASSIAMMAWARAPPNSVEVRRSGGMDGANDDVEDLTLITGDFETTVVPRRVYARMGLITELAEMGATAIQSGVRVAMLDAPRLRRYLRNSESRDARVVSALTDRIDDLEVAIILKDDDGFAACARDLVGDLTADSAIRDGFSRIMRRGHPHASFDTVVSIFANTPLGDDMNAWALQAIGTWEGVDATTRTRLQETVLNGQLDVDRATGEPGVAQMVHGDRHRTLLLSRACPYLPDQFRSQLAGDVCLNVTVQTFERLPRGMQLERLTKCRSLRIELDRVAGRLQEQLQILHKLTTRRDDEPRPFTCPPTLRDLALSIRQMQFDTSVSCAIPLARFRPVAATLRTLCYDIDVPFFRDQRGQPDPGFSEEFARNLAHFTNLTHLDLSRTEHHSIERRLDLAWKDILTAVSPMRALRKFRLDFFCAFQDVHGIETDTLVTHVSDLCDACPSIRDVWLATTDIIQDAYLYYTRSHVIDGRAAIDAVFAECPKLEVVCGHDRRAPRVP